MGKKYLIEQYAVMLSDYRIADNDEKKWDLRKGMARIEKLAMEEHGFDFADLLPDLANRWLENLVQRIRMCDCVITCACAIQLAIAHALSKK